ncbi:MAG: DUF547 domain-containing protein [Gammaproteobacteria bacterium]
MTSVKRLICTVLVLLLISRTSTSFAAPKPDLWPLWAAHDKDSSEIIDHSAWNAWLGRFVVISADSINRVAYARVAADDRKALQAYIQSLAALDISTYNRAEQFAYWVNLYNALTIDVVLEHYPVQSIREIKSGFFSFGPWGMELITIKGEALTLDDIEHRILRPIWLDARIHYAVNCASLGCPNLQRQAFTAANTESLLETAAREFINHPRGAKVEDGRLVVSSIYDWFEDDFGGNDRGVIEHLKIYAETDLRRALSNLDRISDDLYDWQLNGSLPQRQEAGKSGADPNNPE